MSATIMLVALLALALADAVSVRASSGKPGASEKPTMTNDCHDRRTTGIEHGSTDHRPDASTVKPRREIRNQLLGVDDESARRRP
jgi:hypothetical protein